MRSKELLSEVLKTNAEWVETKGNEIFYNTDSNKHSCFKINIYEFMFLCKEWAVKKKWIMKSGINKEGKGFCEGLFGCLTADTEPEAVIKACEFIREKEEVHHVNLS